MPWLPKVNRHISILVENENGDIKLRPGTITDVGEGTVDARVGHHGETYEGLEPFDLTKSKSRYAEVAE